jgi:hypothetical protein
VRHLPQLPAATARTPCMEGISVGGMEGREKQGSVGDLRRRAPPMLAAGVGADIRTRGVRPDFRVLVLPLKMWVSCM